jgi:hypothetical protein
MVPPPPPPPPPAGLVGLELFPQLTSIELTAMTPVSANRMMERFSFMVSPWRCLAALSGSEAVDNRIHLLVTMCVPLAT